MGAPISRLLCQGVIEAQSWLLPLYGRSVFPSLEELPFNGRDLLGPDRPSKGP